MPTLERWRSLWKGFGKPANEALYHELIAAHSEPHRHFHTLQHLDECLEKFDELRGIALHAEEIELALWFHDAIFDPRRDDNEARSAEWARSAARAAGTRVPVGQGVEALVMCTRHDVFPRHTDRKIAADCDLGILAADPTRFDEYVRQVRAEYGWMSEPEFRAGRTRFVRNFLERKTIFNTEQFIDQYEARARANLERWLAALTAST